MFNLWVYFNRSPFNRAYMRGPPPEPPESPTYPTQISHLFDAYVDAVIERIRDNEDLLVPPSVAELKILEVNEGLNHIAQVPSICVIPIREDATIYHPQGAGYHTEVFKFETLIIGFYQYRDIPSGLREVRKFGYNCLDLFTGENQHILAALENGLNFGVSTIDDISMRMGYVRSGDTIIHSFQVTLPQVGA